MQRDKRLSRKRFHDGGSFMKGISRALLASIFVLAAMLACGPSLKGTIQVPTLKIAKVLDPSTRTSANTYLFVDEFVDARSDKTIALVDGKQQVQTSGEVLPGVVQALKDSLGNVGFTFSDSAPVVIAGQLRKWKADISDRMPTKISADAQLYVEVLDPANKKIYSGVYNGFSTMESNSIGEAEVGKTLSASMEEAVKQVTADRQLISLLQSY